MREQTIFCGTKLLSSHLPRVADYFAGKPVAPVTVELDMTNVCNHRCPGCSGGQANKASLKVGTARNWVLQLQAMGVRGLILNGGGEPLMHPDTPEIAEFAASCGLRVGLITNGGRLHTVDTERLLRACTWIRVSLDASDLEMYRETHGMPVRELGRVWRNLCTLLQKRADTGLACTVGVGFLTGPHTKRGMLEIARQCSAPSTPPDYLQYRPFNGDRTPIDDVLPICQQYSRPGFRVVASQYKYRHFGEVERPYRKCYAASFVGTIQADGNVALCCFHRGTPDLYLGNMHEQTFEEIWYGERKRQVIESLDLARCVPFCRGDGINRSLCVLDQQPEHEEFL